MVYTKTEEQVALMKEAALLVSKTLSQVATQLKPGMTTLDIDQFCMQFVKDHKATLSFHNYHGYPHHICASVNDVVVHGFPNKTPLKEGDIISIDCGALKNGFYGDHAYTFAVGEIDEETKKLLEVTKQSLYEGIRELKAGNRIGDVGYAIQKYCEDRGYGVVRELVGHGLGKKMHEDPEMPNYGKRGRGKKLINGMVVAIEPMINMGTHRINQLSDGWTILTKDGKPSAHFEHDIAIINGKPELLSTFKYIYEALGISSDEENEFRISPM
mgnify:CR=1 FL=1